MTDPLGSRIHPFLDCTGPVAVAHRGGAQEAPENTMLAFQAAIDLGYTYLETDVHVTRDGFVLAFHDDRLDRVTDGQGAICELTLAEVQAADAAYHYSRDGGRTFPLRGQGIGVPLLQEILQRWPAARLNVDPKSDGCVRPLVALIEQRGDWGRVCFGSFSDARLRKIRAFGRGRACTSMGPRAVAVARVAGALGLVPRQHADCLQVPLHRGPVPIVTARFVRAAHRRRLAVHVWTINDRETMEHLLDLGVDGIMTDHPRLLRDVFAARGLDLAGRRAEQPRPVADGSTGTAPA
jgi:glycerophosphoryl diester phosphodiesterase